MRALLFTGATAVALALAACGGTDTPDGDETDQGNGGSGTDSDSGTGGSTPKPTVEVETDTKTDVPGFANTATATVTVEDGGAVTYSWAFKEVPEGSKLENSDLEDAKTKTVSFVPDLGGDYVLEVTIKAGGETLKETVTVKPPTYDVPFVLAQVSDADGSGEVAMFVKSGGERTQAIGCNFGIPTTTPEEWANTSGAFTGFGVRAQRLLFPQALDGVAAIANTITADAVAQGSLQISSSNTRCSGALQPKNISSVRSHPRIQAPRFSPNGKRMIAVNDGIEAEVAEGQPVVPADDQLVTFGVDNSAHRILKTWTDGIARIPDEPLGVTTHMTWITNSKVAWIDKNPGNTYRAIYTATDAQPAVPQEMMNCNGFATATGLLVTSQLEIPDDDNIYVISESSGGQTALFHLTRDPDNSDAFSCDPAGTTNLNLSGETLVVTEFELAGDKKNIVFVATDSAGTGLETVYVVPADGSAAPAQISPDDGSKHTSPHFALGGRQIVWSATATEALPDTSVGGTTTFESPTVTRLHRANVDGSHVVAIYALEAPDRAGARVQTGQSSGNSCMFGLSPVGFSGGLGFAALGLLAFRRRTRRQAD